MNTKADKPNFTQYMAFGVGCSQLIGCIDGDALSALIGFAIGILLYNRYYDV